MPLTDQPIKKYNHNLTQPYDKQLSADKIKNYRSDPVLIQRILINLEAVLKKVLTWTKAPARGSQSLKNKSCCPEILKFIYKSYKRLK